MFFDLLNAYNKFFTVLLKKIKKIKRKKIYKLISQFLYIMGLLLAFSMGSYFGRTKIETNTDAKTVNQYQFNAPINIINFIEGKNGFLNNYGFLQEITNPEELLKKMKFLKLL